MISTFLPAFIPLLPYYYQQLCFFHCNNIFLFFIALNYNNLFLWTEVAYTWSVHFMQKKSQMLHQTPLFMGPRTEAEPEENLSSQPPLWYPLSLIEVLGFVKLAYAKKTWLCRTCFIV